MRLGSQQIAGTEQGHRRQPIRVASGQARRWSGAEADRLAAGQGLCAGYSAEELAGAEVFDHRPTAGRKVSDPADAVTLGQQLAATPKEQGKGQQ